MRQKNKEINTEHLVLKNITNSDLDNLKEMLLNDEIKKTYMIPDFNNEEELNRMCNRFIKLSNDLNRFLYGVYLNNKLIGFINEVNIKKEEIEVGYVIDPKYKGNGFATETLEASIKELTHMGYKTVKVSVFEENIASQKVALKAGMIKTEIITKEEHQGIVHDIVNFIVSCI